MDVPEDGDPSVHSHVPLNEAPEALVNSLYRALSVFQQYGWFILVVSIALLYIWQRYGPTVRKRWRDYQDYLDDEKKDPDRILIQQEAMERSRQRLQEIQNAHAERFKERQQQLEEQKRREKIEDWDRHVEGKGYRSKMKKAPDQTSPDNKKPKSKSGQTPGGFNPLMGTCDRPSYRPGRRDVSGGG